MGVTGNSAIDPYSTQNRLDPLFYPIGTALTPGAATTTNYANKDLSWEKTTAYNYGVDFSFFNTRISGSLDYFTAKTTDLLLLKTLPTVTGYANTYSNVGETKSNGLELTLNTVNIEAGKFRWGTTINASMQANKIEKLTNGASDDIQNNWFIGEQLGVIYGYKSNGLWKESDAAEMALFNANGHNFSPGTARPVDLNGDYKIDANNDRTIVGNTLPKYVVGMTNSFKYGDFELSVFLYGRLDYTYNTGGEAETGRFNQRQINYYTEVNQNAEYQKPVYTAGTGDPYATTLGYKNGSFIRIRNISLGYNFPKQITERLGINGLRLYVQVINPGYLYSPIDFRDMDTDSSTYNRGFVSGLNFEF